MKLPVYLDYLSTTPVDERVVQAMLPYFTTYFGNASAKGHAYGWQASEAVELARAQLANLIDAEPGEITFTSGATESVNLAIKGIAQMYSSKGNHMITVTTEHSSVRETCGALSKGGTAITYINVDAQGRVDPADIEAAIRPQTILICVMYANNETGVLQPVKEIGELAQKYGIIFFTDATQAIGKIPVNVKADNIHAMAFSSHKLYGPKGVGALYLRRRNPRVRVIPQLDGGKQEEGIRSGTLNVPGIAGFGKACEICSNEMEQAVQRLRTLRDHLETQLLTTGEVTVNGSTDFRLPHVSNISFKNIEAAALIKSLRSELAVSSSSACTSAHLKYSGVLRAMFGNDEQGKRAIRFSAGRFTTEDDIEFALAKIKDTISNKKMLYDIY